MANPNIVNVATINANTSSLLLTTTNDVEIVSNPVSSGKVYKINSLLATNINTTTSFDVTVKLFPQDNIGGTGNAIASTITIPAKATLVVLDKSTSIYLLEDKSIGANASSASNVVITCSWEEIA